MHITSEQIACSTIEWTIISTPVDPAENLSLTTFVDFNPSEITNLNITRICFLTEKINNEEENCDKTEISETDNQEDDNSGTHTAAI